MSNKSSVGVCIPTTFVEKLLENSLTKELLDTADVNKKSDTHQLYYWEFTKWNDVWADVRQFMNELKTLDEDDYLFVEICDDIITTYGSYTDNPFGLGYIFKIIFDEE